MKSDRRSRALHLLLLVAALLASPLACAAAGDGLHVLLGSLNGSYVAPTPGTTASVGYIEHEGLARRYVLIRPQVAVAGAPMLVLLHARDLSPERMANLTRAGRLAATEGAWVYLPAAVNGSWNDSPSNSLGRDDVGFIAKLIDAAVRANGLDARRVYAAGYSNGGFMAERLACELSSRLSGIAMVAATLRTVQIPACALSHPMPIALFAGTSDYVVPYNGIPGLASAPAAIAFWAQAAGCGTARVSTLLPDLAPGDGTRVTLTRYSACPTTADARLYTITGGGHTWPGSPDGAYTVELGRTSQDLDATYALWRVLIPFSRP